MDYNIVTNILEIRFSEQETLTVINPSDIEEYGNRFEIVQADRVYWQWYYYGKIQEEENLCYYDIARNNGIISGLTNAKWNNVNWSELTSTRPAVLLT